MPASSEPNQTLPVIAVVEDSLTIRRFTCVLLEDRYRTVEYGAGIEALEGLAASLPDLVLLDITLPDIDGPIVLQRLRDDPALRQLPVIAFTAHDDPGDRERYLARGFDAFVTKPIVDENELFGEIDRLLGRDSGAAGEP